MGFQNIIIETVEIMRSSPVSEGKMQVKEVKKIL